MSFFAKFLFLLITACIAGCVDSPEEKKIKEQLYGKWTLDGVSILELKKNDEFSQTNIRFSIYDSKHNKTILKEVQLSEGEFFANDGKLKKRHFKNDGVGLARSQMMRETCELSQITSDSFVCGPNTWKRVKD